MDKLKIGRCVKDVNAKVVFQNDLCIKTCGDMNGAICSEGCMESYSPTRGMTLMKNLRVDHHEVDAVLINDGVTLTTLLYINELNKEVRAKEIAILLSYGLSKSELNIFLKVIDGKKNSQIKTDLFISKSTLKTHLNNIYKKLPENYQQYKKRH